MNISIIIFTYNEKETIERVIHACLEVADSLSNSYEIIIVDDGSTDGTGKIASQFHQVKYIRHSSNAGIGMAIRTGYSAATMEFVCAVPGDGQFDVYELLKIKPFGFYTFYSFFRPETNYNLYRKLLTKANKTFNHFFLKINLNDVNWVKVYRKDQLNFTAPELTSSLVESEICAKLIKSGCSVIEIPSKYHARENGISTGGSWRTLSKALSEILELYKVTHSFKKN